MSMNWRKSVIEDEILKHYSPNEFVRRDSVAITGSVIKIGGMKIEGDKKRFNKDIFYHPFANLKKSFHTVFLPETLKVVGEKAFEYCIKLENVHFPKKLEVIQLSAFLGCQSLEEITIYPHLQRIDAWAFSHCPKLKRVRFMGTKQQFKAIKIDPLAFDHVITFDTNEGVIYYANFPELESLP